MAHSPRIYLHPDGQCISIGFTDTGDTLLFLKAGDNHRDAARMAEWVAAVQPLLEERAIGDITETTSWEDVE